MKQLPIILLFPFLSACCLHHAEPVGPNPAPQLRQIIADASASVATAEIAAGEVVTALDSHPPDVPVARAATTRVVGAINATAATLKTADAPIRQVEKNQIAASDNAAYIDAHENDWFGPRAHRLFHWVLGIGIAMGVGCILVTALSGPAAAGILGNVGKIALGIGHVMTLGLGYIVGKLRDVIQAAGQKATTPAPAAPMLGARSDA